MSKANNPKITAKQEGGDDGYQYVIRVNGKAAYSGLTRSELPYYKAQALKNYEAAIAKSAGASRYCSACDTTLDSGEGCACGRYLPS